MVIRFRLGNSRSGPGFRTIVTRYLSLKIGQFELKLEWTTRAALRLRRAADEYFTLKERAKDILCADDFDDLEMDLDDHWSERGSTHASASTLIRNTLHNRSKP